MRACHREAKSRRWWMYTCRHVVFPFVSSLFITGNRKHGTHNLIKSLCFCCCVGSGLWIHATWKHCRWTFSVTNVVSLEAKKRVSPYISFFTVPCYNKLAWSYLFSTTSFQNPEVGCVPFIFKDYQDLIFCAKATNFRHADGVRLAACQCLEHWCMKSLTDSDLLLLISSPAALSPPCPVPKNQPIGVSHWRLMVTHAAAVCKLS